MIGQTISHYRILEQLGGGGMGIVYKAEDTRLKRTVALKFLPPELTRDPEAKERFIHEAQAASALQHNNICVVHDIDQTADGEMFIVMECYDGETLKKKIERGPLTVEVSVDIAGQIARGLARAHEHGIVHRDIKPANIIVTTDGAVKIVDFGLAKLSGQTMLTKAGSTLGTVAYMSPEQARGETANYRTDLWSLGVLLYEMLTGRRPFEAEYEQATIFKILNESPAPLSRPEIPKEVDRIVAKAMAKDPASRYASAEDMARELLASRRTAERSPQLPKKRRVQIALVAGSLLGLVAALVWFLVIHPPQAERHKSIAVLPITSITRSASDQEFADGLHDHLLTQLSSIRDLVVISRQSVLQYRETQKRSKEIAAELGVQMLMEASVQQAGGRLRMQVQLIDGITESHLWANTYDRQLTDIFAVQTDLAHSIATALQATITPQEKAALEKPWTSNPEALQLYLKGANLWATAITKEYNLRSAEYLDQACRLDPQFAAAFAMAAHVHANIYTQGSWDSSPSRLERAETALHRAQALDPDLPETHIALGSYARLVRRDIREAGRELEAALALRPNDYEATHELAFAKVQSRDLEQAFVLFQRAEILNPLAPMGGMDARAIAWTLRRWDVALRLSEGYLTRFPDDRDAYALHARLFVDGFGDFSRAEETLRRSEKWSESHPWKETEGGWPDLLVVARAGLSYFHRDYATATRLALQDTRAFRFQGLPLHMVWLCRQEKGVREYLDSVIVQNEQAISRDSANGNAWLRLALAQAVRGEKTKARQSADRAQSLQKPLDDPWMVPEVYREWLASAFLVLGEDARALAVLDDLLSRPNWLTVWKLRLDPLYDPLRNDPRFKALLEKADRRL